MYCTSTFSWPRLSLWGGEDFLTFTLRLVFELTQEVEEARELDVTSSEHVAGYEIRPYLRLASGSHSR